MPESVATRFGGLAFPALEGCCWVCSPVASERRAACTAAALCAVDVVVEAAPALPLVFGHCRQKAGSGHVWRSARQASPRRVCAAATEEMRRGQKVDASGDDAQANPPKHL